MQMQILVYMKTMVISLCCRSKSCISLLQAGYGLMADNTLFRPIIDFIGRHLSRAGTGDDGEQYL